MVADTVRGAVHPQVASWLASVRQRLEAATATHPCRRPIGLARADLTCQCQDCAELKAFLADRQRSRTHCRPRRLAQHLIGIIDRHLCDVKHAWTGTRSPYSLVLTETIGPIDERAVKRFEVDQKLLSYLPVAE